MKCINFTKAIRTKLVQFLKNGDEKCIPISLEELADEYNSSWTSYLSIGLEFYGYEDYFLHAYNGSGEWDVIWLTI